MKKFILLIFIIACACKVSNSFGQAGTLDSSFGANGRITNNFNNYAVDPPGITIQQDGKIIVVGASGEPVEGQSGFLIIRYQINGSLDSSFGNNGKVITNFDSGDFTGATATSVLILPDNKILVGGYGYHPEVGPDTYTLARYLPNGNPDSTFGKNKTGTEQDFIGPFPKENELYYMALQKDGKILAAGFSDGYCVVRYKSNGIIDSSFADEGIMRNQNFSTFLLKGLSVQSSGKIITVSSAISYNNDSAFNIINRLLPNGTYDASFGSNGFVTSNGDSSTIISILQLPDNSFFTGSYSSIPSKSETFISLTKYHSNGTADNSFGINGTAVISAPSGSYMKLFMEVDGKIIVAGSVLTRFTANGIIDSTFGINGQSGNYLTAWNAALQTDQKIVTISPPDFTLSRYQNDIPIISVANINVTEGNSGFTQATFKVKLSKASATAVNFSFTTKDGTAVAGQDYVANAGTHTFSPGQISKTIIVDIIGDTVKENNEKFYLLLSNATNAVFGVKDSAVCTIKNDDLKLQKLSPDALTETNNFKLYPDPVTDNLTINFGNIKVEKMQVEIINEEGRIMLNKDMQLEAGASTQSINVALLSSGVYYVRCVTADGESEIKFVKVH